MVISSELLKLLHEVPEDAIQNAAEVIGAPDNRAFTEVLARGALFRQANTTPVYYANDDETMMLVTCQETVGKRLH